MACFSCGSTFTPGTRELVMRYKKEYEKLGIERYLYKLETNGALMIIKKEYFNEILISHIKPNFHKGSEYMHIREYTGT